MLSMSEEQFLDVLEEFHKNKENKEDIFRLGTVSQAYKSGLPTVILDGDADLDGASFSFLSSYQPRQGDRVFCIKFGSSYLVAGKIDVSGASVAFDLSQATDAYLFDLDLSRVEVNQSLSVDSKNNYLFATQAFTASGDSMESFQITRMGLGGNMLDSMSVRLGGHGTSIGVESVGSQTYIWSNIYEAKADGSFSSGWLVRFPYAPNTEMTLAKAQKIKQYPSSTKFMTPISDNVNGVLAIRFTDSSLDKTSVTTHLMSDLVAGTYEELKKIDFTSEQNGLTLQGMTLDGDDFYVSFGTSASNFVAFQMDMDSGKIKAEYRKPVGLNSDSSYDAGYGEPEGLCLYTDSTGNKILLCVVTQDLSGRRRQKVFGFVNGLSQKLAGMRSENGQGLKLTRDDGKGKRFIPLPSKLASVFEPGDYYLTTAETNSISDFPLKGVAGWFFRVSAQDSDGGVMQELIRNSTTTPQRLWRIARQDGTVSGWRQQTDTAFTP